MSSLYGIIIIQHDDICVIAGAESRPCGCRCPAVSAGFSVQELMA